MRHREKFWPNKALRPLQQIGNDLGTVFLGAAAIFLVRAFPASNCGNCNEFDIVGVVASGGFFVVGMVMRILSKPSVE
jgi:hypothetical protein